MARIRKAVVGYNKDTLEIKEYFESTYQAGKNGYPQVQVVEICKKRKYCKTCRGLRFMYEEEWVEKYGTRALDEFLEARRGEEE